MASPEQADAQQALAVIKLLSGVFYRLAAEVANPAVCGKLMAASMLLDNSRKHGAAHQEPASKLLTDTELHLMVLAQQLGIPAMLSDALAKLLGADSAICGGGGVEAAATEAGLEAEQGAAAAQAAAEDAPGVANPSLASIADDICAIRGAHGGSAGSLYVPFEDLAPQLDAQDGSGAAAAAGPRTLVVVGPKQLEYLAGWCEALGMLPLDFMRQYGPMVTVPPPGARLSADAMDAAGTSQLSEPADTSQLSEPASPELPTFASKPFGFCFALGQDAGQQALLSPAMAEAEMEGARHTDADADGADGTGGAVTPEDAVQAPVAACGAAAAPASMPTPAMPEALAAPACAMPLAAAQPAGAEGAERAEGAGVEGAAPAEDAAPAGAEDAVPAGAEGAAAAAASEPAVAPAAGKRRGRKRGRATAVAEQEQPAAPPSTRKTRSQARLEAEAEAQKEKEPRLRL
ncbi:hypothetical protein C2E21_6568 isoform B [Chlorella sorokiniana]|uniref:Uncharacterized protein n=1 Tax=Chlorella sorokiniana TaxID=3076 RepID=A0A2P6TJQ4_CHLSO|nr:hypothetical protein C2E21_6568 isoform B [Chlorella sorokiniana]|eukprot:PRW44316.1 hypothetical protein C2E21_6568 isoform B [Chlorella sorokiniana]